MGTVGINFGAASSGQGFDVASTVTAILGSEQAIEAPWKTQLSALQAQDAVFSTLGSGLSTLTTALQSLSDFSGVLAQKQGASSDTNVLALSSATAAAVAGGRPTPFRSLRHGNLRQAAAPSPGNRTTTAQRSTADSGTLLA